MFRDDPHERLEFFRSADLPGVEVLRAHNSTQPWHVYHVQYAACACLTAATSVRYRGRVQSMGDRSVSIFEPGESHRNGTVHKSSDFKVLFIDPEVMRRESLQAGLRDAPAFHLLPKEHASLFDPVYRLCAAIENGATLLTQQSRLAHCIGRFLETSDHAPRASGAVDQRALERAKSLLVERFSEAVSLEELSLAAGLSRFHLVRAFARRFGMPPHAFQVHVRIERGRAMLRRGMHAAEVASAVGFADQSHFTRHFRRIWGVTPGAYARRGA